MTRLDSEAKTFSFSVGSSYRVVLAFWLGAALLLIVSVLTYLRLEPGPTEKHWRSQVRQVAGIGLGGAAVLFAVGCMFLRDGWKNGERLDFDEDGVHWRTFWGNVVTASWDDVQLNSGHRFESVPKGEVSPLIPSHQVRLLAEALHELTAEREVVAHAYLQVESSKFHLRTEQNGLEIRSLMRWNTCRMSAELIKRRGGTVVWENDGFSQVSFAGTKLTDEEFAAWAETLSQIPQLVRLDLSGTRLTAASLTPLVLFPSLEVIEVAGSGLDPASVRDLLRLNAAQMPSVAEPFPNLNAPRSAKPQTANFDFLKDGDSAG